LDKNGDLLWCKRASKDSVYFHEPVEDNDGNFWLAADRISNTSSTGIFVYLLKLDKNGNFLQGKRIVFSNKKVSTRHLVFDKKTASVIFTLVDHVQNQLLENQYIFAIDKNMTVKWAQKLQPNLGLLELKKTDNFLYFVGFIFVKNAFSSIALGKIDINNGKTLAFKVINQGDYPYLSCNSKEIAIGFYNNNRLSKYDENLNPIWTTEFTNCTEKTAIFPSLAETGECFFTRDIQDYKNFIFAKTNPQGLLDDCSSKKVDYTPFKDTLFNQNQAFSSYIIENAKITLTNAPLNLIATTLTPTVYCPKPDAGFELPKSICENAKFSPFNIKILAATHLWTAEKPTKDTLPKLYFVKNGLKKVFHSVTDEGCTDTTSRWITVLQAPKLPNDTVACNEKSMVLDLKNTNSDTTLLDNQIVFPPISISKPGTYNLILKNKVCQSEGNIKIDFVDTPPISLPIDSAYCTEEPYFATVNGFENVIWDTNKYDNPFEIRDNLTHTYVAKYKGCLIKGNVQIPRKTCPFPEIMYIPTIFSPNDDGINDFFEVFGEGFTLKKMSIFDRWGNQIFYSEKPDANWNGSFRNEASPPSIYTYHLEYQDFKRNVLRYKKGDMMLVR
jgi:gliding motility-associated-like protein